MKKLMIVLGIVVLVCTGCGNYDMIDTEYEFDKIICDYDGDKFELEIDQWSDYDGEQIQVKSGRKVYVVSMNKCYMVKE